MSEFYARYNPIGDKGWYIYKDSGYQAVTWAGPFQERETAETRANNMNTEVAKYMGL